MNKEESIPRHRSQRQSRLREEIIRRLEEQARWQKAKQTGTLGERVRITKRGEE